MNYDYLAGLGCILIILGIVLFWYELSIHIKDLSFFTNLEYIISPLVVLGIGMFMMMNFIFKNGEIRKNMELHLDG